jgi:uracil-DNA glycosylase
MSDAGRPDARKSLDTLRDEWISCVKCGLGERRIQQGSKFVFGQGYRQCVMFVGEGPGVEEEAQGAPFIGRSGQLLKRVLSVLGLTDFYCTNLVSCRSCERRDNPDGSPLIRTDYRTGKQTLVFKDVPPTPVQRAACRPRLMEEIYLVDPIVIVGLGGPACEELLGRSIAITREHGEVTRIAVPGASYRPVLTEKKQQWLRKIDGEWKAPTEQNEVYYYFVPTLHPAYVLRQLADKGPNNPFQTFAADLRKAVRTYDAYLETVFGVIPSEREDLNEAELHYRLESENE